MGASASLRCSPLRQGCSWPPRIWHLRFRRLPDVDIARTEAIIAAREIPAEQIVLGIPIGNHVFEVCEEDQFMVFKLAFKDILHS